MNEPKKPLDLTERMRALSHATDRLREYNEARETIERKKVRKDPAGNYIAIAFNRTTVMHWIRTHGISPNKVRVITNLQDTRGIGHDLIAICFPDWGDRHDREFHQAVKVLEPRIIAYRYSDQDKPEVEKGRIIGWTNIHPPVTKSFTSR